MRKALLLVTSLVCAAALAVVTAPASATTTSNLEAAFQYHYGHAARDPCGAVVFAGASGEDSFLDYFAGDVQVIQLSGTLALA